MVTEHPVFISPENINIKIWKYMNVTKFVWLLRNNALYFARADKLGDPFEGSRAELDTKILLHPANEFVDVSTIPAQMQHQLPEFRKNRLQNVFINCWHMNDCESAAMWTLYGNNNPSGAICIQSTFNKLQSVLPNHTENPKGTLFVGQVKYIDYTQTTYTDNLQYDANELRLFVHKRKSYEHEKEVRAVVDIGLPEGSTNTTGLSVPVSIKELIENVYVSPNASEEFFYIVRSVIDKQNLDLKLTKSDLDKNPLY